MSTDIPNIHPRVLDALDRTSSFTAVLLSWKQNWEDESAPRTVHETVLRPLLAAADECWAYGLRPESKALAAAPIRGMTRSRHELDLSGDPIRGHEFFWNAHGGKRGSVVISIPADRLDAKAVFANCLEAIVVGNPGAGHSPAALAYAKRRIHEGSHIVACLPRNNGIQWMDIFAPKPLLFSLYATAAEACGKRDEA